MLRFRCLSILAGGLWLWSAGPVIGSDPVTEQFAVETDTCVDSRDPLFNYGVSTTAKVVVNGMDGSLVRSLFALPPGIWEIPHEQLVSAKIWFYVWFDQTEGRTVRLHPLTRAFIEGTGDATPANDGATWQTSDGQSPWNTPGGDYDAGVFVDALEAANWFSWDITPLWANTELRSFGALLKMDDESDPGYPNMPRAPFTSSDGPANERPYVEITYHPEPTLCEQHVIWADADGDDDVDQDDFAVLQICRGASEGTDPARPEWCECLDYDGDGEVGNDDWTEWEHCATGPDIAWDPLQSPDCQPPGQ